MSGSGFGRRARTLSGSIEALRRCSMQPYYCALPSQRYCHLTQCQFRLAPQHSHVCGVAPVLQLAARRSRRSSCGLKHCTTSQGNPLVVHKMSGRLAQRLLRLVVPRRALGIRPNARAQSRPPLVLIPLHQAATSFRKRSLSSARASASVAPAADVTALVSTANLGLLDRDDDDGAVPYDSTGSDVRRYEPSSLPLHCWLVVPDNVSLTCPIAARRAD